MNLFAKQTETESTLVGGEANSTTQKVIGVQIKKRNSLSADVQSS